jgi:hypothetical protein
MTELLVCVSCGGPGTIDPRDGDELARCVPCRRRWRRSVDRPAAWVEPEVAVGRRSGDPFGVHADRELMVVLDDARELVLRVQRRLPLALDRIALEEVTGFPSSTPGASDPTAPVPMPPSGPCQEVGCVEMRPCPDHDGARLLPVERAAMTRIHGRTAGPARQLDKAVRAIRANAQRAQLALDRLTEPPATVLCSCGAGREGVVEWGNPLCRNVPDPTKGGMCDGCWQLEQTWRTDHDLEPRERTAPPRPPAPRCVVEGCERPADPKRTSGLCGAHHVAEWRARRRP